ncbi:MAG: HAD-IA family hydrolase, partial [Verrucomicrobiota bacterium]
LSDTNPWHLEYLLANFESTFSHFQGGTTSFAAGCLKPDARIFQTAARTHGFQPEEAIFIDDVETNVDGARQTGMQGIRYQSNEHASFLKALAAAVANR